MSAVTLFRGPLTEKYRPRCWDDVVGQEKVVARIRQLAKRGSLTGRASWPGNLPSGRRANSPSSLLPANGR
jgi:hypothetical protein